MGIMSSMARCMRENRLSRRLSNAKPHRLDDDSNDLIKTISHAASVAPTESTASSSTMVQNSSHEPVMPTESHAHREYSNLFDLNIRTLFDEVDSLDPATSRAIKALSLPDYPVLRMETIQSPFDTPTKETVDAIDPGEKGDQLGESEDNTERSRKFHDRWGKKCGKDGQFQSSGTRSRIKRSMTGLLRRRSLKSPQTPSSLKTLRNPDSPKWIDASSIAEEDFGDEKGEKQWLEVNGLGRFDVEYSRFGTEDGLGRLW